MPPAGPGCLPETRGLHHNIPEEPCVGHLALALGTTHDAANYGLRILRTAGLVHARREGRLIYYRLATNFPEPLLEHFLREPVLLSRAVQSPGGEEG